MQRNTYFTGFLVAILVWICIFQTLETRILSCILSIFFCILLFYFCYFFSTKFPYYLYFSIILGLFVWVTYSSISFQKITSNQYQINQYSWLYNAYHGEVLGVKKRSDFYDEYTLRLLHIWSVSFSWNILHILRVPKNFSLEPGQEISYAGKMYRFEDFNGFSYEKYMLSQGFYFSSSTSNIQQLSSNTKTLSYKLFSFRQSLLANLNSLFPKDEAVFLSGILFWARENIASDLQEDFNNSWLTHLIAVSGFNITLCILFSTFLFGFLPSYARVFAVSTTIIIFSFFVWLWAPVVRAAIMGIVGYIFLQSGNTTKNITLLAFTAVCMALWSPLSLYYDVSLHLSFLAVIGIIYTQEYFKKIFFWIPKTFAIQEASVLTLSALSFALPLMMFQFGQVSLLAPFANIAVTWTIPFAMLTGSLTLCLNYFSPFLSEIFGFIPWILLHYDILMVRFFGNLEFALLRIDVGAYGIYLQMLYFIILLYILSYLYLRNKKQSF